MSIAISYNSQAHKRWVLQAAGIRNIETLLLTCLHMNFESLASLVHYPVHNPESSTCCMCHALVRLLVARWLKMKLSHLATNWEVTIYLTSAKQIFTMFRSGCADLLQVNAEDCMRQYSIMSAQITRSCKWKLQETVK